MILRTGRYALLLLASGVWAEDRGRDLFVQHVRPLLEKNCLVCHGGQFKKSGLDLSTRDSLLRGGDSGPVVVAGNASQSLLVKLENFVPE